MEYKIIKDDKNFEVIMGEKITSNDFEDFKGLLNKFLYSESSVMLLNYSETVYMDSAALGFLLVAKSETELKNKDVIIKKPSNNAVKIMNLLNFDKIFKIEK